jgi:hypothetical protein
MFYVVLLMAGGAATLLMGCGGHTSTPPQTYTITVTATAGTGAGSLQHTTTFSLTVQQ